MSYVALNVHSQYSILDSTISVEELAKRAKALGMESLALTDQGNLYGAVDFYKACKGLGIKPIIGCEIWMAPGARTDKRRIPGESAGYPIVLLAKSNAGYKNLSKLSSIGFLEGFYYQPRIDREILQAHSQGLICLSGPLSGRLAQAILKDGDVEEELSFFLRVFGPDFYLELQRHPVDEANLPEEGWLAQAFRDRAEQQEKVNRRLILLHKERGIPIVATGDVHYLDRSDARAHEILLNVQSGETVEIWERDSRGNLKAKVPNPKREVVATNELYFKSSEEMRSLFADVPEAIENTIRIAQACHWEVDFKAKHYPVYVPPHLEGKALGEEERKKEAEAFLYEMCRSQIPIRYTGEKLQFVQKIHPDKDPLVTVKERFEYEFALLSSKGMCDYMLIVWDFIHWAKKERIPVGPGRGSAAGSIISYLMGITDIEPLRFHLFFERFINPERVSYPDIDVDICMERRPEVIDYVVRKYGKERVAQIITFGTMKAKMAIRDVGRVLNVPLSKVNQIAGLIPEDPTMTLEKAFELDPELTRLMESDEEAREVLEMAKKAEGSIRNTSTHAAGMIISAGPITDYVPVCTAKDSEMVVTQFAMKPAESVGMLKIDFLGLKTLTSLHVCTEGIRNTRHLEIDWANLPLDDRPTFNLLNQGKTLGIFQLESGGMQELARQLHIDRFEEIIAVGALYRPGPMDMIPSFVNRKHGREAIEIDHPLMKEILLETYGVMVYQEQVMQIASTLAGYSLGEGDVLRRAMGKKDKEEMGRQREKFLKGARAKEIASDLASLIFDKIEKFASYGFNKSHAAAYAYLSYATAYFKANFPKEWLAALMTCDSSDISKIAKFIREARSMGIALLPPDVNQAGATFAATEEGIRFSMSGIKGVGEGVVEAILEERKRGRFESLYDFISRVDQARVGKKAVETLIAAGAFDFTKWSRDAMLLQLGEMFEAALDKKKEEAKGVLNLFSLIEEGGRRFDLPPQVLHSSSQEQILHKEKELLGFYLTGHPMDAYRNILGRLSAVPLKDFEQLPADTLVRAAFVVETVQTKISSKSQKKFAICTISDGMERFELPVWPELFEEKGLLLKENGLVLAILSLERREGSLNLQCKALEDLTTIDEAKAKAMDDLYDKLKGQQRTFEPRGKSPAKEKPKEESGSLKLKLDAEKIQMSGILSLKELFRSHPGASPVEIQFVQGDRVIGLLSIGADWGVKLEGVLKEKLKALDFASLVI
jgi:DNA polymerase-3 subunit alpha